MNTRWGVVVLSLAACGGGGSAREKQVCEHAAKLCDAEAELQSCQGDLADVKKSMGDKYEKFLDCSLHAKSCGEYLGCAVGGLGVEALDQLDGFGKGMKQMMKNELGDLPELDSIKERVKREVEGVVDDLPGPCKRIAKVCAPDEPFVRDECRRLVQNLGEDKAHLGELASCIAGANTCFALRACVDKLDDALRGR